MIADFGGHLSMGDLQDPKMEVLYHKRPYFVGYSLKFGPKK